MFLASPKRTERSSIVLGKFHLATPRYNLGRCQPDLAPVFNNPIQFSPEKRRKGVSSTVVFLRCLKNECATLSVFTSGCTWRSLPPRFPCQRRTAAVIVLRNLTPTLLCTLVKCLQLCQLYYLSRTPPTASMWWNPIMEEKVMYCSCEVFLVLFNPLAKHHFFISGTQGFRLWVAMDDLFSAKQVSFCADTWGDGWNNPPGLSQRVTVSTFNVPWTPTLNGMGGPTTKLHIRLWDFEFLSSNGAILRFFISTQ